MNIKVIEFICRDCGGINNINETVKETAILYCLHCGYSNPIKELLDKKFANGKLFLTQLEK